MGMGCVTILFTVTFCANPANSLTCSPPCIFFQKVRDGRCELEEDDLVRLAETAYPDDMLVFRGHTGRWEGLMGVYCLDRERGLVNGKCVWKLQGSFRGIDAWYLFYAGDEAARWCVCSTDMFEESFGFVRTAVS